MSSSPSKILTMGERIMQFFFKSSSFELSKLFMKSHFQNFPPLNVFLKHFLGFLKINFVTKKPNTCCSLFCPIEVYVFASIHYKKSKEKKMFLLHADISENGFYTIFCKFNRSVTKLEDADEIRSIDGTN